MLELGPYGSMRGARSNARPYRDPRSFSTEMVKANVCTCPLRPERDSQPSICDLSLCANRDRRTVAKGTSNRSPHRRVLQSPANRAERVMSRGSKAECRPHDYDSYGQSGKYNFGHYIPHPLMQASHFIVSESSSRRTLRAVATCLKG